MPTELEELVSFLHHGNAQIRQVATASLVGYSTSDPNVFKTSELTPVKDLKQLVKDYAEIAKSALTILINISEDAEILKFLAEDEAFVETLIYRLTNPNEPNANDIAMLLANLAKCDSLSRLINAERSTTNRDLSTSKRVMDQLLDLFAKGAEESYNKNANFDYLAFFFADMARFPAGQTYFTTPHPTPTSPLPLTALTVFITHSSSIRRKGVAFAIKNAAFALSSHGSLLGLTPNSKAITLDTQAAEVATAEDTDILPYILRPLVSGADNYTDEESDKLPEELQLLDPDVKREADTQILQAHLETIMVFTGTREGREALRNRGVYPVIREIHLHVEDNDVRDVCDRIVQIIMRDEEPQNGEVVELDEEEEIIEIV